MNMNPQELIRGQEYTVTEFYGMCTLTGKYLGQLRKGYSFECFVFKRTNAISDSSYPYFGAVWKIVSPESERPQLHLQNTHYGNSAKGLKRVNEQYGPHMNVDFRDE